MDFGATAVFISSGKRQASCFDLSFSRCSLYPEQDDPREMAPQGFRADADLENCSCDRSDPAMIATSSSANSPPRERKAA